MIKTTIRKLVTFIMALAVLGCITAFAANTPIPTQEERDAFFDPNKPMLMADVNDWEFYEEEEAVYLLKYIGTDAFVDVPSTLNEKQTYVVCSPMPMAERGGESLSPFQGNTDIMLVNFNPGVKFFENTATYMFEGCTSLLMSNSFPDEVTDLSWAYAGCTSMDTVDILPSKLKSAWATFKDCTSLIVAPELPEGLENLSRAFEGCSMLATTPLTPSTVTDMRDTYSGTAVTDPAVIPEGVTSISGIYADCLNLTTFPVIPEGVKWVSSAFENCPEVTGNITFPDSVGDAYATFRGTVKPINLFMSYESLVRTEEYPSNVTITMTGEPCDWVHSKNLDSLLLEKYIGTNPNVIVPATHGGMACWLNYDALRNNTTIETIEFEPGLKIWGTWTSTQIFDGCTSLVTIVNLPENLETMENLCTGLPNLEEIKSIPANIKKMSNAFKDCPKFVRCGVIPEGVEVLYNTFENTALESFPNIPSTAYDLAGTFEGCAKLTGSVEFTDNVKRMGSTFYGTKLPITVTYPAGFMTVENEVSSKSNIIKNPIGTTEWNYERQWSDDARYRLLRYVGNETDVIVPSTFKELPADLGSEMFRTNTTVKSVEFPVDASIQSNSANYMFYGCLNLETVKNFPNDVTSVNYTFYNCRKMVTPPEKPFSITNAQSAFQGCTSLTSAWNLATATNVQSVYSGCTSLASIPYAFTNAKLCTNAFAGCTALTGDIKFGGNVTSFTNVFAGTKLPITLKYPGTNSVISNATVPANVTKLAS